MAKRRRGKRKQSDIRERISFIDDLVTDLTGKPIKAHIAEFVKEFADSFHRKMTAPPFNDPYQVLGVSRDGTQDRIKEVYLKLQKLYHEAGEVPNMEKAKEVNSAYQQICAERGWSK